MSVTNTNTSTTQAKLETLYVLCDHADREIENQALNDAYRTYQQVISQASQLIEIVPRDPNATHALIELHLLSALGYTQHAKWQQGEARASNIGWAIYHCMLSLEALRASGDFSYTVVSAWHLTYVALLMEIREMVQADTEAVACIEDMIIVASTLLGESLVYENEERIQGIEYMTQARLLEGFSTAGRTPVEQNQILQQALVTARKAYWHFMETSDMAAVLETQTLALNLAEKIARYT